MQLEPVGLQAWRAGSEGVLGFRVGLGIRGLGVWVEGKADTLKTAIPQDSSCLLTGCVIFFLLLSFPCHPHAMFLLNDKTNDKDT